MLRECDPYNTSTADVTATVRMMNEVLAQDLPEDPPWQDRMAWEYLTLTMPGERRFTWMVDSASTGIPIGRATLLVTEEIGVIELMVGPSARNRGVGRMLLSAVANRARTEGVDLLGVEVAGDTSAVQFYESHGFRCACTEVRGVLKLSMVDWLRVETMAAGIGAGYRVEVYTGGPPRNMYETYTSAKEAIRNLEIQSLELHPSSYGPQRLADSIQTLTARGLRPHVVVAIHERSETVAALTEVVIPAHRPTRADQYDTIVVPTHRGYGADRALKARMLLELRKAEPDLVDVQTWDSVENAQMMKINSELGFQIDREWLEYATPVATLLERLDSEYSPNPCSPSV